MPNVQADGITLDYDHHPDVCPICHHAVSPKFNMATLSGDQHGENTVIEMSFKCTHRNCLHMFIGIYKRETKNQQGQMIGQFKLKKSVPLQFKKPHIHKEVAELSPSFVIINEQAHAAESHNLDEITGVGYRKALEFLIKDYCIKKHPDKENEIKGKFLGKVIDEYVLDENIKACANRAAWLGNDETHYVRKWEEKDISDLKILIELTSGWIRNNVLTEKYIDEMNGKQ